MSTRFMTRLANMCVLIPLALAAHLAAQSLSAPDRAVSVPSSFDATPVWSRGYLFHLGKDNGSINVYATGGDVYQVAAQTRIWPEGTKSVSFSHAAAAPAGAVFATAGSTSGTNGALTGFVAFFGSNSTPPRLVQLPGAAIFRLVFADDGTLWALLREYDSTAFQELGEYNMLRHYDSTGKFLGSAVPRSRFRGKIPDAKTPMFVPTISASHDTVGIYFDKAETWIELTYDGTVKGAWGVPNIQLREGQRLRYPQIFLTMSNKVIRVSPVGGKNPTNLIDDLKRVGTGLESTTVDWSALAAVHPYFLGVDGDDHMISMKDGNTLHWSKVQR